MSWHARARSARQFRRVSHSHEERRSGIWSNGTGAVVVAGLIAALSWFSIASFKIDLAIVIVARLLAGYLAGERRGH